jgi:hypothetical protein
MEMAKQRPKQDEFLDERAAEVGRLEESAAEAPAAPKRPTRYRVTLACPTPLLHRTLEVEAPGEEQAKLAFCKANGISDSVHPWTIEAL